MNKDQFIHVLHHVSDSSAADAQQVLSLKTDFPYSQMLHTLAARLSRDHGFSTQQQELQLAAVYASDRAVLKEIMTQSGNLSRQPESINSVPTTVSYLSSTSNKPASPVQTQDDDIDFAEEIIHDLDRLHVLKHNFEMMFVDVPQIQSTVNSPQSTVTPVAEAPVVAPASQDAMPERQSMVTTPVAVSPVVAAASQEAGAETPVKPKESSKARKARIVELARQLAAAEAAEAAAEEANPKPGKKKKEQGDHLIEEIRSTKQEIEPAGEKLKEQIKVIDQFIKQQPSISANTREKINAAPVGDLTTIKNGEFGDNIVSETLVEILLRQGKKDKAIEVLKKLIWKFPQKKTYFAAQIEELKK